MPESQKLTTDQKLQAAIESYAKIATQTAFERHGGQDEKFEEYYEKFVKTSKIELTPDNSLLINGSAPDRHVGATRRQAGVEKNYFDYASRRQQSDEVSQPHPAQTQKQVATTKSESETEIFVSMAQLNDRVFLRKLGPEAGKKLTAAIQQDLVKVDGTRAISDPAQLRQFLVPKQIEQSAAPKAETKPAPKPRTITQAQAMDRNFLRKLEQEWSSQGGYLQAVRRGDITIA